MQVEYQQLSEKVVKCSSLIYLHIFVRLDFLDILQPNYNRLNEGADLRI
jgi:hypothetical protein